MASMRVRLLVFQVAVIGAAVQAASVVHLDNNENEGHFQHGAIYQQQPFVLSPHFAPNARYSGQLDSQRILPPVADVETGRFLNLNALSDLTTPAAVARADLVWGLDGSSAGWVLLYQRSATSNLQAFVKLQGVSAAQLVPTTTTTTCWRVEVRPNPIASSGTRCASGTIGGGPFNPLNERGVGVLAPTGTSCTLTFRSVQTGTTFTNVLSTSSSVAPSIATMFGPNSIIGRSIRIASDFGDVAPIFCGNIVQI